MKGLMDFLQAASNTASDTVAAPVDLFAWLMNKAGVPVQEPVGGTAWQERQGLRRKVEQSPASLAGETMGLLSPVVAAAKAPQIAAGLLKMGENAAAPATLSKQTGAVVVGPRSKALEEAQRNAAKPVSEGGLGLGPNNTAAERAKAMGFVEKGFHGSADDFTTYKVSGSKIGGGSGSREGPLGAWLADDPRVASEFASWSSRGLGGDTVYPMMIRGANPLEIDKYSAIKDVVDANTKFSRPPYRMMQDKIDYDAARKQLAGMGDYVALRNTKTDSIDKPITQYLVADTSRLRSPFAAFDPAKRDSADILATLAALGISVPMFMGDEK